MWARNINLPYYITKIFTMFDQNTTEFDDNHYFNCALYILIIIWVEATLLSISSNGIQKSF